MTKNTTTRQGVRDLDALAREASKPKASPAPAVKAAPLGAMTASDFPGIPEPECGCCYPDDMQTAIMAAAQLVAHDTSARCGSHAPKVLRIAAELLEVRR